MDERTDKGEFYPEERRDGVPSPQLADKVDRVNLGEVGDSYSLKDVKSKVNQIVRALGTAAVGLALVAIAGMSSRKSGAATAPLEDIPNNAPVVTNEEDVAAMGEIAVLRQAVEGRIADGLEAASNKVDAATNALSAAIGRRIADATNAIDAAYAKKGDIPEVPSLEPYALKSELPTDYVKEGDIADMATKSWVNAQGYSKGGGGGGGAEIPEELSSITNAVKDYGEMPTPVLTWGWYLEGAASYASSAGSLQPPQTLESIELYQYERQDGGYEYRWASRTGNGPTNFLAYVSELPAPSVPSAPEVTTALRWRADGTACVVTVAAGGTLTADTSNWTEGQAVMAIITLAEGAGVAQGIELVSYGAWPVGTPFVACCYKVGLTVYVVPSTTL